MSAITTRLLVLAIMLFGMGARFFGFDLFTAGMLWGFGVGVFVCRGWPKVWMRELYDEHRLDRHS